MRVEGERREYSREVMESLTSEGRGERMRVRESRRGTESPSGMRAMWKMSLSRGVTPILPLGVEKM